jgi:hypothetical protein
MLSRHSLGSLQLDPRLTAIWTAAVRLLFVLALAIYLGGFTFYSVVVIPVLHDRLESSFETGLVTQRVTDMLNLLGVVTLSLGWCIYGLNLVCGFRCDRPSQLKIGLLPLLLSSVCLVVLLILHRVLDRKLETGTIIGFYTYHRAYLWSSTVQWFANLWLLARSTGVFTPSPRSHR